MAANHIVSFTTLAPPVARSTRSRAPRTSRRRRVRSSSNVPGIVTAMRVERLLHAGPEAGRATTRRPRGSSSSPRRRRAVHVGDAVRVSGTRAGVPGGRCARARTSRSPRSTRHRSRSLSTGNPLPRGDGHRDRRPRAADDGDRGRRHRRRRDQRRLRPGDRRHRLLREPRGHARPGQQRRRRRPDATTSARSRSSPTTARTPASGRRAAGSSSGPNDFNPERISLDDDVIGGPTPAVNVGDHFSGAASSASSTTTSATSSSSVTTPLTRVAGRAGARGDGRAGAERARVATFNVENLDPADAPAKFDALAGLIVNNLRSPGPPRARGGPGQQRRDERRRRRREPTTLNTLIAADPGRGRPDLPVPPDRPGRRPGRRRAGRQHPPRLPLPHRPRAAVRRPAGRRRRRRRRRSSTTPSGPRAVVQPRPHRPDQPGLQQQPQAARRRVHASTADALRDRQPLQLEGRRPPALRPLPAADRAQRGAAAPAGADRERLRRRDPRCRPERERRRRSATSTTSSSPTTVTILEGGVLDDLIETLPAERALQLRVRRQLADARPHPGQRRTLFARPFEFDVVHVNSEFADQASDHDPSVAAA